MADLMAQLFAVIGVDITPPQTIAELIPYLLTVLIAVAVIGKILSIFGNFTNRFIGGRLV